MTNCGIQKWRCKFSCPHTDHSKSYMNDCTQNFVTYGMHASFKILSICASETFLSKRVSVLYCMHVCMEAFHMICCARTVANPCPLSESWMCAKVSREEGTEEGREGADTMQWCHRPCGVAIQSDCLRWWCSVLSKRPNTIMSAWTENRWCVCKSLKVCVCVCACKSVCVCECICSLQEEETEAHPLFSAALIYLDVHDVILPGGLPCQAEYLQVTK